jgi:transcriptional regulator with XRE-family HTH domain
MADSFGARLRERREQQQISLGTIAEQTKIKLSLLEALERGDVSHWPSGIFRRAFIRAYAHAIGLEPDVVVHEFLELYPDPAQIVEPIPALAAALDGPGSGGAPMRLRYLVASAVETLARRRARQPSDAPVAREPQLPAPRVQGVAAEPRAPIRLQPLEPQRPTAESPAFQQRAAEEQKAEHRPTPQSLPVESITPERVPEARVTHQAVAEQQVTATPAEAAAPAVVPQAPIGDSRNGVPETPAVPTPIDTIDLPAMAELCTRLGQVSTPEQLSPLLEETARVLEASGLVVWLWDPVATELYPALAHGYSDHVLAQLPGLPRDANNATAAAFREGQTCVVPGTERDNGALVLPLLTPSGCAGVLALEMQKRGEERESVRAAGAIVSAQLAALISAAASEQEAERVRSAG